MPLLYPDRPTKYPVVNPDPSMSDALSNFNFSDIRNLTCFTLAGAAFGWFGASKPLRAPNARFVGFIGFLAGMSLGALKSSQRLLGLEPNESEVVTYGALSESELKKYRESSHVPGAELIGQAYKYNKK